jgi:hypothetical protein
MPVGRIVEIWRYPVKSMAGERLRRAFLGPLGIPGDRGFALRDEAAGEIRGAKKMPELLRCRARYLEEPAEDDIPPAEVALPDGECIRTDAADVSDRLSRLVGRRVSLWPRRPPEDREHYRRRLPTEPASLEGELREMFGRLPEEPLPDLSLLPSELLEFTSPLGTYFDAFPLHLLTTTFLAELSRRNPTARFDSRRFRPNLLIDTNDGSRGFVDFEWVGRRLRIGGAVVEVAAPVVRCVMTTLPQEGLEKDPSVLRTIVREAGQNAGVYATVLASGPVRLGDPVELV